MKFEELNLNPEVTRAVGVLNFSAATEIQAKSIPVILSGKDMVGRSETGSGKTLAFGLPAINLTDTTLNKIQTLVVCPTRELAEQVTLELRKVANSCEKIKVVPIFGGADMARQVAQLKTGAKIVVGTPGRLIDHLNRRTLKLDGLKMIVLDEADEMLNMGFRDDIETILKSCPKYRQSVMFSATMPPAIKAIIGEYLIDPVMVEVGEENRAVNAITQSYVFCAGNTKMDALISAVTDIATDKCLIFCNTKRMVEEAASALVGAGINARALHGDMRQSERRRVMNVVRSDDGAILVATDVAARGIDISGIEYVMNYDVPHDLEYYIHRIGRTARAGKSGKAITLVNTKMQENTLKDYAAKTKGELTQLFLVDGKLTGVQPKSAHKEITDTEEDSFDGLPDKIVDAVSSNDKRAAKLCSRLLALGYPAEKLLQSSLSLLLKRSARSGGARTSDKPKPKYNKNAGGAEEFSDRPNIYKSSLYKKNQKPADGKSGGFKSGKNYKGKEEKGIDRQGGYGITYIDKAPPKRRPPSKDKKR